MIYYFAFASKYTFALMKTAYDDSIIVIIVDDYN